MTRPLVVRGDAAHLPLPDASVDLILTSPPYFALRSYTDGGEHYAGQIGSEATPAEYIAALVDCTREWMRVLKPSGSIFVNLGDKYSGQPGGPPGSTSPVFDGRVRAEGWRRRVERRSGNVPTKSLMLLPERYRIACVDQLGLIARAVIVWAKPNGLPESVTDRVRRSHEDWVHLTRSPRYFAAVDEIREPHTEPNGRAAYGRERPPAPGGNRGLHVGRMDHAAHRDMGQSALGKLPGSVWEVATEPLQVPADVAVDHFAAFPSEWPRRLILGWSPSGICTACDQGRRPVVQGGGYDPEVLARRGTASQAYSHETATGKPSPLLSVNLSGPEKDRYRIPHTITGYACACTPYTDHPGTGENANRRDYDPSGRGNHQQGDYGRKQAGEYRSVGPWREYHFDRWTPPPTRPAVVLDPFSGTGTVPHVASALGRIGVGVDLSMDYARLAAHPELQDRRRRKVLGLDKPEVQVVPEGQLQIFEDLEVQPKPVRDTFSEFERRCGACGFRNFQGHRRNCEQCGAEKARTA